MALNRAQGNIVLELDNKPAARTLLDLLQEHKLLATNELAKDSEFFVGLVNASNKVSLELDVELFAG